jgi:intracellular multiplication protein IcmE
MKAAGYTADELRKAGFTAAELKDAGFTPEELKAAGFSAKELKDAGFSAAQLKAAGFSPKDLKDAGFTAKDLKDAGFDPKDIKSAGYSDDELRAANVPVESSQLTTLPEEKNVPATPAPGALSSAMPVIPGQGPNAITAANIASGKQMAAMAARRKRQEIDQKYRQEIQQRTSEMLGSANQALGVWKQVPAQTYVAGQAGKEKKAEAGAVAAVVAGAENKAGGEVIIEPAGRRALIKTGDVLFAVIDTSVNSDEPSPILATVVSGKFKGARLIGSFNLPNRAGKMIITFNMMSVPGAEKTTPISAVAIDTATARTALSSRTNRHILQRYGSLFASSFLQGFGNAFQSANTTITIGGTTAGPGTITVSNGVGRSLLENAVIGLTTLGQNWAQVAQQQFNRPTTVEVYSGSGVGVLFTQDIFSL